MIIISCQKEENISQETISLKEAQTFFENSPKNERFLIEPRWETFQQGGKNPNQELLASVRAKIEHLNSKNVRVLFIKSFEGLQGKILIMKDIAHSKSRQLFVLDLQGNPQEAYHKINDGKVFKGNLIKLPKVQGRVAKEYERGFSEYSGEDNSLRWDVDYEFTDDVIVVGTRPIRQFDNFFYTYYADFFDDYYSTNLNTNIEPVFSIPESSGGSGFSNGKDIAEKIIDKITDPKISCLHDKLRNGKNDYVKQILDKFEGDGTEFDIEIKSEPIITDDKGKEWNNSKGLAWRRGKTIHIRISENQATSGSALEVAKTIFHEYIHADIYRKLNTVREEKSPEIQSFRETYSAYINMIIEKKGNISAPQKHHEYMAKHYVSVLSSALKQFHKEYFPEDIAKYEGWYEEPINDKLYEAIAWGGLKEHMPEAYISLDDDEKVLIQKYTERAGSLLKKCD